MVGRGETLRWVMAGILCLVVANGAWADVKVRSSNVQRKVNMTTVVPGSINMTPPPDATGKVVWPEVVDDFPFDPDPLTVYHNDRDNVTVMLALHRAYVGAVVDGPGNKVQICAVAVGEGSSAGRLQTSLIPPDTAFAGVGLYGPGPTDSMLIAIVNRSNPTQLGITFSTSSALQVRALAGSHEQPRATFRMLIYENDGAADADPNNLGAFAKFNGTVVLDGGRGTVVSSGGFGPSDWILQTNGPGKYTARPAPGLTKIVPVLNSTNASVKMIGDPSIVQATPGQSTIILILLALALAGTGVWAIRRSPGSQMA